MIKAAESNHIKICVTIALDSYLTRNVPYVQLWMSVNYNATACLFDFNIGAGYNHAEFSIRLLWLVMRKKKFDGGPKHSVDCWYEVRNVNLAKCIDKQYTSNNALNKRCF